MQNYRFTIPELIKPYFSPAVKNLGTKKQSLLRNRSFFTLRIGSVFCFFYILLDF